MKYYLTITALSLLWLTGGILTIRGLRGMVSYRKGEVLDGVDLFLILAIGIIWPPFLVFLLLDKLAKKLRIKIK